MLYHFSTFPNIQGALIGTVYVLLACLAVGVCMHLLESLLTNIMARVIGSVPAFLIRNYLTYPGTICHELAHALVATITGAQVTKITLVPHGTTLGSVEFRTRGPKVWQSVQSCLASIAPVPVGIAVLISMYLYVLPNCQTSAQVILFWYLFVCVFFHMTLSLQDLRNMVAGLPACMLVIFVILLISNIDVERTVRALLVGLGI